MGLNWEGLGFRVGGLGFRGLEDFLGVVVRMGLY